MYTFTPEERAVLPYFSRLGVIECPRCDKKMSSRLRTEGEIVIVRFKCIKRSCGYEFSFTQEELDKLEEKDKKNREEIREAAKKFGTRGPYI